MPDDKKYAGAAGQARISLTEPYELRDWSKRFGITADAMKAAVAAVGPLPRDVEAYLQWKK